MKRLSRCVALASLACLSLLHEPVVAQDQTLKIVYPFSAGGSGDAIARVIAGHLQKSLGRPVIVENKTGAGGRIGAQAVKESPPDGATLLLAAGPQFTLQPHVLANLGYDPFADFVPIARIAKFDLAVAVSGKIPPRSIKDLAAWLRANPDQAVFGSPGAGTAAHFAAMTLTRTFDLSARHVFYRGTPAALPDLLEGRVPIYIASSAELLEHDKSGGIRILATTGAERSSFSPDSPDSEGERRRFRGFRMVRILCSGPHAASPRRALGEIDCGCRTVSRTSGKDADAGVRTHRYDGAGSQARPARGVRYMGRRREVLWLQARVDDVALQHRRIPSFPSYHRLFSGRSCLAKPRP